MRQPSLLRRYILFFCGVLCAALGIALITLAGMGTSKFLVLFHPKASSRP